MGIVYFVFPKEEWYLSHLDRKGDRDPGIKQHVGSHRRYVPVLGSEIRSLWLEVTSGKAEGIPLQPEVSRLQVLWYLQQGQIPQPLLGPV